MILLWVFSTHSVGMNLARLLRRSAAARR